MTEMHIHVDINTGDTFVLIMLFLPVSAGVLCGLWKHRQGAGVRSQSLASRVPASAVFGEFPGPTLGCPGPRLACPGPPLAYPGPPLACPESSHEGAGAWTTVWAAPACMSSGATRGGGGCLVKWIRALPVADKQRTCYYSPGFNV